MVRAAGAWLLLALLCSCASDPASPSASSAAKKAPPEEATVETFIAQSGLYSMMTVSEEWTQDYDVGDPPERDLSIRRRLVPVATSSAIWTQLIPASEFTVQQAFAREKQTVNTTLVGVVAPIEVNAIFSGPDGKLWGRQGSYCGTLRYGGEIRTPACMLIAAVAFREHVVHMRGIAVSRSTPMMDFLTREQKAIVRSLTFFDSPRPSPVPKREIESNGTGKPSSPE